MKLAAVDLGSNSFRLEIVRVENGEIFTESSWKETVRLAAGLNEDGNLTEAAQNRALDALGRISEKIKAFSPDKIRAVGTQTLRAAHNSAEFIKKAETVLGHTIEILRGKEEARLVFEGCSFALPPSDKVRLIIDIGGASTECALGVGHDMIDGESFHIGCVNTSVYFFKNRKISAHSFKEAILSAESVLAGNVGKFIQGRWEEVYGSSGTISAVSGILQQSNLTDGAITPEALEKLKLRIIGCGDIDKLNFAGLKEDRREVLAGGVAVLIAVFRKLHINKMRPAGGALRYGLLFDLMGRRSNHDPRATSVERILSRVHADEEQANRVSSLAKKFYCLENPNCSGDNLQTLEWASKLFEVGLALSRNDYHKHGAYIIRNSDLAGFSRSEQERMAALVLGHRGSLKKVKSLLEEAEFRKMLEALRLAALFFHNRTEVALPNLELSCNDGGFEMVIPAYWCEEHQLTTYMLRQEVLAWDKTQYHFKLEIR